MVLIFGWGSGDAQDLGEIAPVVCPNCHNDVFLHHIKSDRKVSLFFVPLASYGTDEYLACPICRHGLHIAPADLRAVDQMQASTSLYRRGTLSADFYRAKVDEFWQRVGVAPSGQQVVRAAAAIPPPREAPPPAVASPAPAAPSPSPSPYDALEGYARLHADGVLTDEEFAALKRRLLGI